MLFFVAHHQTPKRLPGQLERVFQHVSRIVDFSTPTVTIGDRTSLSILPIFAGISFIGSACLPGAS
jgi:hypothetical protein